MTLLKTMSLLKYSMHLSMKKSPSVPLDMVLLVFVQQRERDHNPGVSKVTV